VYIDSLPSSSRGQFSSGAVTGAFRANTSSVTTFAAKDSSRWSNLLISAQLRAIETVKPVSSISLRPLHIMQWSFHIRQPNYHAQKTLVKRMLRGAELGIDCANYCDFGSPIAEGDRG
jgi:hypothetical protein